MTTVKLVRHALHDHAPEILCGRMPGVALGVAGRDQLSAMVDCIGPGVTAVFSSPQIRCQQTAAAIGLPVVVQPALNEIDFGAWTGRRFDDLEADPVWRHWNRDRDYGQAPDGESAEAAQARAVACVLTLGREHPGGCLVLVTHGDIIKSVLCHVLGLPLRSYGRIAIDQASVSTLVLSDADVIVTGLNALGAGRVSSPP